MTVEQTSKGPTPGAQAVRRAIAVLRIVASGQERGVRLLDVARATGINRATVHRLLQVLIEEGAVEQDPATRLYLIGRELPLLGLARSVHFPIRTVAAPVLRELSDVEGETSFLTIRNGDDSICLDRHPGSFEIKVLSIAVGARRPLGVGVSGLVLLAGMPQAEVDAIVQRNRPRLINASIDPDALLQRVDDTRRADYAFARTGIVAQSRALAVPIRGPDGTVLAGLAIAAIAHRLPDRRVPTLVQVMKAHARTIGDAMGRRQAVRTTRSRPG